MKKKYVIILLLLVFVACQNKKNSEDKTVVKYLFIAHTRIDANSFQVNPIIENMDFSVYDLLFLGGDIAKAPFVDLEGGKYLDSVFDLSNSRTNWILGNHEYWKLSDEEREKMEIYKNLTKRNTYYAFYKNNITFVILDTQDDYSNISGKQLEMIKNITDTIENSSNLIILHHKLIWMLDNENLQYLITYPNPTVGDCFDCLNPNNFYTEVYPLLLKVKEKGINVTCIGGDTGFGRTKFEYETHEGIIFIANGIKGFNSYRGDNTILVIEHDLSDNSLKFNFEELWRYEKLTDWELNQVKKQKDVIKKDSTLFFASHYRSIKYNHLLEEQIYIDALENIDQYFITLNDVKKTDYLMDIICKNEDISRSMPENQLNDALFPIIIELKDFSNRIINDEKWYSQIKQKANEKNISVKNELYINVFWLIYNSK